MGEVVPAIDFSPTGGGDLDNGYSLERIDVESTVSLYLTLAPVLMEPSHLDMMRVMDDLEQYAHSLEDEEVALNIIRETKASLEKLVVKMDGLETNFDRIAERSCAFIFLLSGCCLSNHSLIISNLVFTTGIISATLWV